MVIVIISKNRERLVLSSWWFSFYSGQWQGNMEDPRHRDYKFSGPFFSPETKFSFAKGGVPLNVREGGGESLTRKRSAVCVVGSAHSQFVRRGRRKGCLIASWTKGVRENASSSSAKRERSERKSALEGKECEGEVVCYQISQPNDVNIFSLSFFFLLFAQN